MDFLDSFKNKLQKKGLSELSIQNRIKRYYRFLVTLLLIYVVIIIALLISNKIDKHNVTILILLLVQVILCIRFIIIFRSGLNNSKLE